MFITFQSKHCLLKKYQNLPYFFTKNIFTKSMNITYKTPESTIFNFRYNFRSVDIIRNLSSL